MGTFYSFKITSASASVRLVLNEVNKPKETLLVATDVAASVKLIANAMYDIEISYSPSAELSAAPTLNLQFALGGSYSNLESSRLFPWQGDIAPISLQPSKGSTRFKWVWRIREH